MVYNSNNINIENPIIEENDASNQNNEDSLLEDGSQKRIENYGIIINVIIIISIIIIILIGIKAYITTNKAKKNKFSNGEYTCKESYDVNIAKFDSITQFYNEIGFIQKYKVDRLRDVLLTKAPKVRSVKTKSSQEIVMTDGRKYPTAGTLKERENVEAKILKNAKDGHSTSCTNSSENGLPKQLFGSDGIDNDQDEQTKGNILPNECLA